MNGMLKKERHSQELAEYAITDNALVCYLLVNSNLPGKRGNIELALAFADYIEKNTIDTSEDFKYCLRLIAENPEDRNEKGNEEFLPFCAIIALGRLGKIDPRKKIDVLELLKVHAKDTRWRVREAVAMAIQDLLDAEPEDTLAYLTDWVNDENFLVHRALVAGLAEPRLMEHQSTARQALEIHKAIIAKVESATSVRAKDFLVLVQGLCYTLSVIITGIEYEGFAYLEELTNSKNPFIKRIVRENLQKNRLKKLNAVRVTELQERIEYRSSN
jgi:hypothetical protein